MEHQGHNPLAIANEFIGLSNDNGLSLMQLLKLSYISHGFTLALLNEPLSNEYVQAWKYGPVFPSIYNNFKYTVNPYKIKKPVLVYSEGFNENEHGIIKYVQDQYAKMQGWELSALTHAEDTPWFKSWEECKKSGFIRGYTIKNEDIKKYYQNLIDKMIGKNEQESD